MDPRTFLACVLLGLLSACSSPPPSADASAATVHNSANSLDWAGTYVGVMPCADCPGIDSIVQLRTNGTFVLSQKYLDRELSARRSAGRFTWDAAGRNVTLDAPGGPLRFQVGENQLWLLDREGRRIEGPNADAYVLRKRPEPPPGDATGQLDGRWRLLELAGSPDG
jgi:copper homeostasis protein (lipoprotein)